MGGTRALAAWEEPGFSTATDAQRRLPVVAGMADWQAEHLWMTQECAFALNGGCYPRQNAEG